MISLNETMCVIRIIFDPRRNCRLTKFHLRQKHGLRIKDKVELSTKSLSKYDLYKIIC